MRQGLIFFIRSRKRLRRRSRRSRRKISPLRTKPKGEMFSSVGCNRTPIFRSKRSFARLDAFRGKVGFGGPSRISVFCASRRHNCVLPAMSDLAGGASGGQTSQIRAQNAPGRNLSRRTALLKSTKTAYFLLAHRYGSIRIHTDQYGSVRIDTDQYGSMRISTDQYGSIRIDRDQSSPCVLRAPRAPPVA